ncbi:MAG: glycosyltransferase, partial [Acidobacteriota bacterium]
NRDGETGLVVPPADPDAVADALRRLLGDDALRARFGAAGRRRVDAHFTVDAMVDRVQTIYETVCSEAVGDGTTRRAR